MRQGPYPIRGQLSSFGREADYSPMKLVLLGVIAVILIGAAIFLLGR